MAPILSLSSPPPPHFSSLSLSSPQPFLLFHPSLSLSLSLTHTHTHTHTHNVCNGCSAELQISCKKITKLIRSTESSIHYFCTHYPEGLPTQVHSQSREQLPKAALYCICNVYICNVCNVCTSDQEQRTYFTFHSTLDKSRGLAEKR